MAVSGSHPESPSDDRLEGWKEVAGYLRRSVRTVQRWERELGLPIRRLKTAKGEIVSASRSGLDAWRAGLEVTPKDGGRRRPLAWWLTLGAVVSALLGLAILVTARPWRPRPRLVVEGASRRLQGETFSLLATGLTPSGRATRWERPPRYPRQGQAASHIGDTADPQGNLRWSMTVGCDVGDDTYEVGVIDDATGTTSAAVTLTVVSNPQCGTHLPDLVAESVTVTPTVFQSGDSIEVRAVIRNAGGHAAPATLTGFRWGQSPARTNTSDPLLGDGDTPALDPGQQTVVVFSGRVPGGAVQGTYHVWAVADRTSLTLESSSRNNFTSSGALQVSGPR